MLSGFTEASRVEPAVIVEDAGGGRALHAGELRTLPSSHRGGSRWSPIWRDLRPEQIDLGRTRARGVRDFKHVLEFAERGARASSESFAPAGGDVESPFDAAVMAGHSRWEAAARARFESAGELSRRSAAS